MHSCVGKDFVLHLTKMLIVDTLNNFNLNLPEDIEEIKLVQKIFLGALTPTPIVFEPNK